MICADTSCWIAYLSGEAGGDVEVLSACLKQKSVVLAPVVLAELLSDPTLPAEVEAALLALPTLEILPGYWERAGKTRCRLLAKKLGPKLADTLIAQICIDHGLPLLTRDRDFRAFAKHAGLKLVL